MKRKLTNKQQQAVELFALGTLTQEEVAAEVGVTSRTLRNWLKTNNFLDACIASARGQIQQHLPEIYKRLVNESKDGSFQHMKLLLDHLDKLEERRAPTTSITFTWEGKKNED